MINYAAVVVCGILSIVLGFLWFGKLFRPQLDRLDRNIANRPPVSKELMRNSMIWGLIGAVLTVAGINAGLTLWRLSPFAQNGAHPACFVLMAWLLVFVPVQINKISWEFKSWQEGLINSGYELVRLALVTTIFWYWL